MLPTDPSTIPFWLSTLRQTCPPKSKAAYWHSMIDQHKIPLVKPTYPTCFFSGAFLADEDIDVCFFNNSGANRLTVDKRFKPKRLKKKYTGDFKPLFVWCHQTFRPWVDLVQSGKLYKGNARRAAEPHDYLVAFGQRFLRLLKKESVPQPLGVKNSRPKKEAPAEEAPRVSPATPPSGTPSTSPSTSPSIFAHPVTTAEFTRWVSSLPFNHWNERDVILHFLGKPNGFVSKPEFISRMEAMFAEAEKSAPQLFTAIKSRYSHIDWGHQGVETGWVNYKEV